MSLVHNCVDSSGWLEYFGKGLNGERFAAILQDIDHLIVPTIILYEVFKRILIQRDEEEALKAVGIMSLAEVVELTSEIALYGAELSIQFKLPMADSLILATARKYSATLWTQDQHFKDLDDVVFIPKADSNE